MKTLAPIIALAAAIGLGAAGIVYGTFAAGGSDSSCYALMAEAFASGQLQPSSALASEVPWPDAQKTFTPGGFVPLRGRASAFAPVCAPGFSLLLAPVVKVFGAHALFFVTPVAGALLVWLTYLAAAGLAGPPAGAMAAVLVATSPAVLYQVVQPMNDVATTALWMGAFVGLMSRRFVLAGLCCGVALLVRPNLLPLAGVAALFVLRVDRRNLLPFAFAVAPCALVVLLLNSTLYGGPFRSGYGTLARLFTVSVVPGNAWRYVNWLIDTHTPFPLLAFASPFLVYRARSASAWLALALAVLTSAIYFFYTPFEDWSYLRFLLPAIALMEVLASAASVRIAERLTEKLIANRSWESLARVGVPACVVLITIAVAVFGVRTANARFAFTMRALEQRYRSAGVVVRDQLPPDAIVLSVWDSGAVRFHGRKEAVVWEALDPAWLDRALEWLEHHGRKPYVLVESWEEPGFRARFGEHSDVGKLDWPPKYEIDRVVRIYDPSDRGRYVQGDRVTTEYLWPLRR